MECRIKERYTKELVVEKSRFIGIIFPCESKEEVINDLKEIKKEHNKARHYCFAYIIDDLIKYSDDGEPQGTAGKPILNLLSANNLNHVCLVVVRYFGGTLLGSGRLLRTYNSTAKEVIDVAKFFSIIEENQFDVEISLNIFEIFKNYLSKMHLTIKNTIFNDKINIVFYAPLDFNEDLESLFYKDLKIVSKSIVKHEKEV